jgi:hypothetical protein
MRNGFRFIGLAAVAALSLTAMAVQQGITLKRSSKVGEISKYRLKAEMDYQGTPIVFSALVTEKVTKVADDGQYTIESGTSEGKVNMGGNEMDAGGQGPGTSVTTFKSTGEVVSITADQSDPNMYRMANLQSLQFPGTVLKVGDSWNVAIKKDDHGSVDAKGSYKVEAQEKVGDYDTYRIHGTMKESIDKDPASVDATYWINVKDGTLVKLTGTWTNAPFPQIGAITAKLTLNREG